MTDDLCQCPKCGRMHRHLGSPPKSIMEQIARDMQEGTFPKKSDATLQEDSERASAESVGWQPISTAPKNGKIVDLWFVHNDGEH